MQFKNIIIVLFLALIFVSCSRKKDNPVPTLVPPKISNFSIATKHVGDATFLTTSPTSTSPAKFTYSSDNNSVALIKGDSVIIEGAGSATITAAQAEYSGFGSGTITTVFTVLPSIYIAGYTVTPLGSRPIVWKNGDTSLLAGYGGVNAIVVQNNHVYAAGSMANGGIYGYPGYWKDGVQHIFSINGEALAIAVIGNDVYVAGYIDTFDSAGHILARLWKNGVEIPLSNPFSCCGQINSSIATGIDVYNNQVFVCGTAFNNGYYFNSAMIWKADGTGTAYSKPSANDLTDTSTMATGIKFQGSDMYVCGITSFEYGNSFLTYWKNGSPVMQSTPAAMNAKYVSLALSGTDVYTTGIDGTNGLLNSSYWKNNVETLLMANAESNSLAIQGSDIYVVGNTYQGANYSVPTPVFWLNGNLTPLSAPYNTKALTIAIQTH